MLCWMQKIVKILLTFDKKHWAEVAGAEAAAARAESAASRAEDAAAAGKSAAAAAAKALEAVRCPREKSI